jgi:hypothetical protein
MYTIIDHLGAILVGTVALVIVLAVSHRARESAVEMAVGHAAAARSHAFMRVLERDIENMRTESDALAAVGRYDCAITRDADDRVESFTVPTLLDPDRGPSSPIGHVTYRREPTGDSVLVDGTRRALFDIVREQDDGSGPVAAGGSGGVMVEMEVGFFALRSVASSSTCPDDLSRVRVEILTATEGPTGHADGSTTAAPYNVSRQGYTFRPPARGA